MKSTLKRSLSPIDFLLTLASKDTCAVTLKTVNSKTIICKIYLCILIDYKFTKVSKTQDRITFSIKNKTDLPIPIPIYGLKKKEIVFKDPKVKVGNGKLGPVDLIIYKDDLYALKRIPKTAIDKPKRIQHIKSEKSVLLMLKQLQEDILGGIYTGGDYLINFNFDEIYLNKD